MSEPPADLWQRRLSSLRLGYQPPTELTIDPDLCMHSEFAADIDPITYEVVRSRFWNINWDHQETVRRVSGSGVVVYGYDFNTSLQTEDGDGVVFGPGNLMFAGCADLVVKWTLEHRSWSGIEPGDVFIQDDPWVGTNHAMDTAVYAPVFVGDELFAWVYNVVHQRELGGVEPGGFVQTATDVFSEATFMPPVKLVERGTMREDVADAWIRRSRLPELILLELKSQLAGIEFAGERLDQLVSRYGAATVKGVMRKMISDTEGVVRRRLRALPEATWRDVRYAGGALPGDRKAHRIELRVRHEDGHLFISNEGTEPSTGSFNITFGQFRACVLNGLLPQVGFDQFLCGAGVLACMSFEPPEEDRITSAHHPAAISTSMGTIITITQAHQLFAKLLAGSSEVAEKVFAASGLHTCVLNAMFGTDQYGNPYANFPFDGVVGSLGAFSWRDGLDHGGAISSTINPVGSVESWEREIPFLYLYRRELAHSGGHGRWRGGATFVSGWTGHRTDDSYVSSGGLFQAATLGTGLAGGMPGSGGMMWSAAETPITGEFSEGRLPATPAELREIAPEGGPPPPKKFDNLLREGDLFEVMPSAGAGYGDPLLREPGLVASDVAAGRLTEQLATEIYGVVVSAGQLDAGETERLRERIRAERLATAAPPLHPPKLGVGAGVSEGIVFDGVELRRFDVGRCFACTHCGSSLGDAGGAYRDACAVLERPLPELDPRIFMDPADQVDDELVVRSYLCPSCSTALDTVVCPSGSAIEWDVKL